MRCVKCPEKAVINMRAHKLALCKDHFLDWIPAQTQRFIEKYRMFSPQERILVAVSGGKDSLSLWDILVRLGYHADGLFISLGIDGGFDYSSASQRLTEKFASERGLYLQVISVTEEYGASVPQLASRVHRGFEKTCSVCGMTKRHIMNRIARQGEYHVLVTGHNLDDEAATLFGNTLNWAPGYLVRQSPVLEADPLGLVRKAKPLCRIYERDMAAYALLRGIEYIDEECPYAVGSNSIFYKELLNRLEAERPGAKLAFYLTFLQAKKDGLFAPQADPELKNIHPCVACGQPTTAPDQCAFCRMLAQVKS